MYKEKLRESFKVYDEIVLKCFCGIFIGAIVAICEVIFGKGLEWILNFREHMGCIMLLGLPFAGLAIVFLFDHWGRISRKGMGLVFEVDQGKSDWIPLRMAPFMVISTWITHFFGGSAGREGVAMQIGATVSHYFGKYFRFKNSGVIFMVAGMAAGFAGLFGTPITAIFFALEVLVAGTLKYRAMSCAIPAGFTAAYVSSLFGLHKSTFKIGNIAELNMELSIKLLVLGILFGMIGGLFAFFLKHTKAFVTNKITNPYKRIFMMGVLVALLLFMFGQCRYSGVGENLIVASFTSEKIYGYDWILKLVLRWRGYAIICDWIESWGYNCTCIWFKSFICSSIRILQRFWSCHKYIFSAYCDRHGSFWISVFSVLLYCMCYILYRKSKRINLCFAKTSQRMICLFL